MTEIKKTNNPLSPENVNRKFEERVNKAAAAIISVGRTNTWSEQYGLDSEALNKALDHLTAAIENARNLKEEGFSL